LGVVVLPAGGRSWSLTCGQVAFRYGARPWAYECFSVFVCCVLVCLCTVVRVLFVPWVTDLRPTSVCSWPRVCQQGTACVNCHAPPPPPYCSHAGILAGRQLPGPNPVHVPVFSHGRLPGATLPCPGLHSRVIGCECVRVCVHATTRFAPVPRPKPARLFVRLCACACLRCMYSTACGCVCASAHVWGGVVEWGQDGHKRYARDFGCQRGPTVF
jgi:hypothetical protein